MAGLMDKSFSISGTESWVLLLCNSFNNLDNEKDFAYCGTQNLIRFCAPVSFVVKPMKKDFAYRGTQNLIRLCAEGFVMNCLLNV